MKRKGKFIVVEGTDGSGKTTQFKLLVNCLRKSGYKVMTFDFPQYEKASSFFVKEYLKGSYGSLKEVGPFKASIFYAMDRFDIGRRIRKAIDSGKAVVSNRYVGSNMGHQGAKFQNKKKQKEFFYWVADLEYKILGIPRPDVNIILHMPARIASKLASQELSRKNYVGNRRKDLHEGNLRHLLNAEKTYIEMSHLFPKDFLLIECFRNGRILTVNEIQEMIWKKLRNHFSGILRFKRTGFKNGR